MNNCSLGNSLDPNGGLWGDWCFDNLGSSLFDEETLVAPFADDIAIDQEEITEGFSPPHWTPLSPEEQDHVQPASLQDRVYIRWTQEQDEILKQAVENNRDPNSRKIKWKEVVKVVGGNRSYFSCYSRWYSKWGEADRSNKLEENNLIESAARALGWNETKRMDVQSMGHNFYGRVSAVLLKYDSRYTKEFCKKALVRLSGRLKTRTKEAKAMPISTKWTETQVTGLKRAIENYSDDWKTIGNSVGISASRCMFMAQKLRITSDSRRREFLTSKQTNHGVMLQKVTSSAGPITPVKFPPISERAFRPITPAALNSSAGIISTKTPGAGIATPSDRLSLPPHARRVSALLYNSPPQSQ